MEDHTKVVSEGRSELDTKPTHALKEELRGKEALKEHKEDLKFNQQEHRAAREGLTVDDPLLHNPNHPQAHHHLQHNQHHAPGEDHKVSE